MLEVAPTPKVIELPPTKDELKAQKKQDRRTLNQLKIAIQPIMDQIRNKYKKFRFGVIDEATIQYLYDEQAPGFVTSDVQEQDPELRKLLRPYELAQDKHGVDGLQYHDGRFFYNLDMTVIEKRLANGYYKRPTDFLADIKRMAKDRRTAQDEEMSIRASELVANVEVDIQAIEDQLPALKQACDQVYARELARAKQVGRPKDVPPEAGASATTVQASGGPIILGEPIPGRPHVPTAAAALPAEYSSLSNGVSNSKEIGSQSSDEDGDIHMDDSHSPVQPAGDGPNTQTQQSQKSAVTAMAHNSNIEDYHNSASTTTSGHKSGATGTDHSKSDPSSGVYHHSSASQGTNGVADPTSKSRHPDFNTDMPASGATQLPDTQGTPPSPPPAASSDTPTNTPAEPGPPSTGGSGSQASPLDSSPHAQASQAMAPPPRRTSNAGTLASILNPVVDAGPTSAAAEENYPILVLDRGALASLHERLVRNSSGCSVEQLEQLNAALMDTIWRRRTSWNRSALVAELAVRATDVMKEIWDVQHVSQMSGESVDAGI